MTAVFSEMGGVRERPRGRSGRRDAVSRSVIASPCRCVAAALALAAGPRRAADRQRARPLPRPRRLPGVPRPAALALAATRASLPTRPPGTRTSRGRRSHPRSRRIIAYINAHGGNFLHPDFGSPRAYGFPYAVVGAGQRRLPIHYTAYGSESDRGPFPIPGGRAGRGRRAAPTATATCSSIDRSRCMLYELYRAFFKRAAAPHWNADSGVSWNLRSRGLRRDGYTSADAAGLPIFPGLVRFDEVTARADRPRDPGHVRVDPRRLDPPRLALRRRHPQPRRAGDGHCACACGPATASAGFTGAAKVIARALKRYGMIVADNGSNWFFSGTSDRRWHDENLNQLKWIPGSAFEVVRSAGHGCMSC